MKAIALGAVLALSLPSCTASQLNAVSVVRYDRDDGAPEVVAKSLVNVGPWVVLGAVHAFFAVAAVAPESVRDAVNAAAP